METREASAGLSSTVSREEREEEVLSFREPATPIESDMGFTIPMPSMPKQMDEFLSLVTGTEPSEISEVVPAEISTVPSESKTLISNQVPGDPSETGEMLSNSRIAAPSERDRLLSSPTLTTTRESEDTFSAVKSATPNEKGEGSAGLNRTATRAEGDVTATFSGTPLPEIEKVFAQFSLPGRGEIYESRPRARASSGYKAPSKINAISTGRIEKYLAVAALLVLVPSLLIYWMRSSEDVSPTPEVTAQDSGDSQLGSYLPATIVEPVQGTKPGESIEWQSAFEPGSGDRSRNRRVQGSIVENSMPNSAASNPSRLAAMRTTEPDQLDSEKPSATRKREKAEKKKVTADDLINDKKKITVDDLINDN